MMSKFELRKKVAQLQQEGNESIADYLKRATDLQQGNESIADYLKRATDLARRMSNDSLDIGMATLRDPSVYARPVQKRAGHFRVQ